MRADVLIVGGGPAGLATAIHAVRAGLSAVVVDRRTPPLDKACGEGLMPLGVDALHDLGIDVRAMRGAPFLGIRFIDDHAVAEGRFPRGEGRGVRRTALVAALVARAEALGVALHYGCEAGSWTDDGRRVLLDTARGPIEGRWLVGADGLHSRVRRAAGLERPARGRRRFGVRRHFAVAPWSSLVEVYWADGAEAYVTPTGPDEVGVALLWEGGGDFDAVLARFPVLRARLGDARPTDAARGAGPFRQRVRRRTRGNVALVGDAAGFLDPLTGEGVTLGFRSAAALVGVLAHGRPLRDYEPAYRRLTRDYLLMTHVLLAVSARPWLRRRVVGALARRPEAFAQLVGVTSGELSLRDAGLGPLARIAREVVRGRPAGRSVTQDMERARGGGGSGHAPSARPSPPPAAPGCAPARRRAATSSTSPEWR